MCACVWSAMSARAAFACGRQTWAGLQTVAGVGRGWKAWLLGGPGYPFEWRATCAQLLMHRLRRCLVFACSSCQCMSACVTAGGRLRADWLWGGGVWAWLGACTSIMTPRASICVLQQLVQMRISCGATHRQGCVLTSVGGNASGGRLRAD